MYRHIMYIMYTFYVYGNDYTGIIAILVIVTLSSY